MTYLVVTGFLALALAGQGIAETPAFEVASIKPADPAVHMRSIRRTPGGRFSVTGMPLKGLITFAYELKDFQVTGGPAWLDSQLYDVDAKAAGTEPTPEQFRAMVRTLLTDRFKLAFHKESKEFPVYDLVAGKNKGPHLTESKVECNNGPAKPGEVPCGAMRMSRSRLDATAVALPQLANTLSNIVGRAVIDKTGLTGKYDAQLEWVPDETMPQLIPGDPARLTGSASGDTSGPSIYSAVQEQLGLKLESNKAPLDIFIIDRAEKASEN